MIARADVPDAPPLSIELERIVRTSTPLHMFAAPACVKAARGTATVALPREAIELACGETLALPPHCLYALQLENDALVHETVVSELPSWLRVLAPAPLPGRIAAACAFAQANADRGIRIGELAAQACMSRFHFMRLFRAAVGISANQYLIHVRLARACQLLASGRSATLAAYQVGFGDQSHLIRRFKRVHGVTPVAFVRGLSTRLRDERQTLLGAIPAPPRMRAVACHRTR